MPIVIIGIFRICDELKGLYNGFKEKERNLIDVDVENLLIPNPSIPCPCGSCTRITTEWMIFIIIATTSLWSFAYFVYWYTGVINFDEIYTWIEIFEWLIPIFITILLLIFGTVVNMEAKGLYKKHKERLANNGNKEWLLLILLNNNWEIRLPVLNEPIHFSTLLKYIVPQILAVVVKYIIDYFVAS